MRARYGLLLAGILLVASLGTANAAVIKTTRDTLATEFFPGTGNPNTDFAITTITESDGNTIEIGVKGKERFVGQENVGGSGTIYVVEPGLSPVSGSDPTPDPDRAWWNFDFSVDLGSKSLADVLVDMLIVDPEGDSYFLDFGDDSATSLIQNSWNIGFGFINTATFGGDPLGIGGLGEFQPKLRGPYEITFSVSDLNGELIGSQLITVQVPSPGPLALLGVTLAGLGILRRRHSG